MAKQENQSVGKEFEHILSWTFISKCDIPKDVDGMLITGENAIAAFKTVRDKAIFTNKRLIIRDVQGITGVKKEIYTIPYSSIVMYSTENAGIIDMNNEIDIWTKVGNIKINLQRGIDIREFDNLMASCILK